MPISQMFELIEFIGSIILSVKDEKEPGKLFFLIVTLLLTGMLVSFLGQNLMMALLDIKL
jgi:hypothetical protein